MTIAELNRWTPIRLAWQTDQPEIIWAPLGTRRFREPFFEQTIAAAMRQPGPLFFQRTTPVSALESISENTPRPAGFIFHMSRCGSTLVTQVLSSLPSHRVISEAPLLDTMLEARLRDPRITHERHLKWFRGMVHALGHGRAGEHRSFFKFDVAHALQLPFIREAFPDVPWIFIYRDPIEVLVSQHRQRGSQMIPGMIDPRRFGLSPQDVAAMSFDTYTARVIALACSAVLSFDAGQIAGGLLINHRDLPGAIWKKLTGFLGLELPDSDLAIMREAATFSGKNPSIKYTDDSDQKKRAAHDGLRALADQWLAGPYQQLESVRRSRA